MLSRTLILFAVALGSCSAIPVVHDRRVTLPAGFVKLGAAPSDKTITLRMNLASSDLEGLERELMAAATPGSATFRQWLSKEEVESFAAPSPSTVSAVQDWLSSHAVPKSAIKTLTPAGDWISFTVPISQANVMLNTNFATFQHVETGKTSIRTMEYSLPSEIAPLVKTMHPTVSFTSGIRQGPVASFHNALPPASELAITPEATVPASCNTTITPACLQALYSIPTTATVNPAGKIGVTGMDNQFANNVDLADFLKALRPDVSSASTFAVSALDGGQNTQTASRAGVEADLDIQYTVGLANGIPVTFITEGTSNQDGDDGGFLDILNFLLAESAPPQVFTTSYGFATETDLSKSLTVAMCNTYMQLTARGVSILFASGDGGVAATPGESCSSKFLATFPTCPFVTLVGATENVNPERGAELSAGGFSNFFAQASYQTTAVNAYLAKLGNTNAGKFNVSGRGYPDVAAQGQRVEIFVSGKSGKVAGTSCASPIFASIVGLLNNELLNAGKPVLGFLNPWMYANPQAFTDITTGNNPGCGTNGFPALAGWDPVTGLGVPNYPAMRTAAGL